MQSLLLQLWVLMHAIQILASQQQIDSTEYAALRVIRNALDDLPGSTFFHTWDFTVDPCAAFRGVICSSSEQDESNHVVMLSLGNGFAGSPGLSGFLSSAIGSLQLLRILTVVPGSIKGQIPEEFGKLSHLEFLGISNNLIKGPIPDSFAALTSLEGLDLSNNRISGSIPAGIFTLPSLTTLILSSNQISGNIPATTTSPLLRLSLDRNQITGGLPTTLPQSLTHLELAKNDFSGSIVSLSHLQRLVFLDLSFNEFSGSIPGSIFTIESLSQLLLQRNHLTGGIDPAGPAKISRIDLSYNYLTGEPSPLLAYAESVFLNNNKLTGGVPAELVRGMIVGDLRNLYLQHNFLTDSASVDALPESCIFCIQYNCFHPPVESSCPTKSGKAPTRPTYQCENMNEDWD